MKKAAAFLTLIALLAMIGGSVYLHQREASPNLNDLQPALDNLKAIIPETMHMPAAAGVGVFLFLALLLALMVLFESRPAIDKPEKGTESPQIPQVDNRQLEEIEQLKQRASEAETARQLLKRQVEDFTADSSNLKRQLEDATAANNNLKNQLEKLSDSAVDSKELGAIAQRCTSLESELKEASLAGEKTATDLQKATQDLKSATEDKKRLQNELDALVSKVEKTENDHKNTRKEVDKAITQLKIAQSDLEKRQEEVFELRRQLDAQTQELKATQANLKGGKDAIPPAAYQILYLFQKEGRLIDLLSEDISELDDETLGGAIRPIHEGCRKLLADRLILERVLNEEEGSTVTLDEIDPEAIKLSGRVPAAGPYKGELIHRGWRLKECNLPELVDGWKGNVIAPAEIEIS